MTIDDLKSFLAVVEMHSISLAANKMHVTQPAMSKRIRKIEQEWGSQLFISSGLSTQLTPKGKQFLPYIRQIINLYEQISGPKELLQPPKTLINVGTSIYIAKTIIPLLMLHMNEQGHDYYIYTQSSEEPLLLNGLKEGCYDLILSPYTTNTPSNLVSLPLWHEKVVAVVGRTHPLASLKKPITLSELITYDAILLGTSFSIRQILNREIAKHNSPLNMIAETNTIYNAIALVERGVGWSMVYERLLDSYPDLKPVILSDFTLTIQFCCYFLEKRKDERLIREFVDHIRNWLSTKSSLNLL